MTITISLGWWMVPTAIMIVAFSLAAYADRDNSPGPYGAGAFISLIIYGAGLVATLIAWLIWALVA
ncbi:hypothetical protein GAO09_19410 [Rhizobiales bacterium RZME27]|uniref:Uncharacterized protein n=1 Tax=Endobacterium cereale TaxID=2663029 RepID=A0A6A8AG56_9HYPH|nr:hypothetical protein [Endobacterium cereale]MQY48206.1 hypothetical protein [Endobacterium cereale]